MDRSYTQVILWKGFKSFFGQNKSSVRVRNEESECFHHEDCSKTTVLKEFNYWSREGSLKKPGEGSELVFEFRKKYE